jgi:hypothetical protein
MKNKLMSAMANVFIIFALVSPSQAQGNRSDVYWHINPSVKSCSMVIDPSLTQAQWHTFTKHVGAISSFKSLASAKTLGRLNFRVGLDYGSTPVDQHDPAWINTFTHPDADCPLGDAVAYPMLRASMGVSDNMDVGGYWTVAPGANYGLLGGEFKYAFLRESENIPAAALRASATILTGVPDFNLNIYSVDVLASKDIAMVTPYVGIRTSLVIGIETTSKVDLERETIPIAQGYIGVAYAIGMLNLAAEYNVSSVNTFALAIGVNFKVHVD